MLTPTLMKRLFWAAEGLLLIGAIGAAAWISSAQEWQPLTLVGLLLALNLAGERLGFTLRGQKRAAGFVALGRAMMLLGPAPAVTRGVVAMLLTTVVRRTSVAYSLGNLSSHALFPLAGGLMVRALIGDVHDPRNLHLTQSVTFGLVAL